MIVQAQANYAGNCVEYLAVSDLFPAIELPVLDNFPLYSIVIEGDEATVLPATKLSHTVEVREQSR